MQAIQSKNYDSYMKMATKNYSGEWVIICEGRIVSHGTNLKKTVEEAKEKCGEKRLMVAKIPAKETMIY